MRRRMAATVRRYVGNRPDRGIGRPVPVAQEGPPLGLQGPTGQDESSPSVPPGENIPNSAARDHLMTRFQRETLTYAAIAALSVVTLVWVIPSYTPPHPGYGVPASLVPNVAVGMILLISVLALAGKLWSFLAARPANPEEAIYPDEDQLDGFSQIGRLDIRSLLRFVVPSALLIPAIEWVGFLPAALGFMLLIQCCCGRREPLAAVTVAVVTVGVLYVAMRFGFGVPLPGA